MSGKAFPLHSRRKGKQPIGLPGVDLANPITRDIHLVFDGGYLREATRRFSIGAIGQLKPTREGRGYEVLGDSSVAFVSGSPFPNNTITVFVLLEHDAPPSRYAALIGRGTYGSGNCSDFSLDSGAIRLYSAITAGGSGSLGSAPNSGVHSYAVTSTGSAVVAYIDGAQSGNESYAWQLGSGGLSWLIGASATDLLSEYMPGKYLLALIWNRVLSAQEIRALHLNPWQVFRERPRILTIPATGAAPQLLAPVSDIADGSWLPSTGADLYATVDEDPYSDTDYMYASSATTCTLAIAAGSDPAVSTGHVLRYRLLAGSGSVTVTLKQNTTTIASWGPHTLTGAAQDFAQTLSAGEADSITDYSALRVEFTAS